jgi:hypothetical protein
VLKNANGPPPLTSAGGGVSFCAASLTHHPDALAALLGAPLPAAF